MTKRDFFRILIKLFGLYFAILTLFGIIPTYVSYLLNQFDFFTILWSTIISVIVILILIALIFNVDKIIDRLKLDRGFDDEKIQFGNFSGINLLKFSVIIIGGLMMIDNIPEFLNNIYLAFRSQVSIEGVNLLDTFIYGRVNYSRLTISGISILIGYLLITNYIKIANWLSRNEKKNVA